MSYPAVGLLGVCVGEGLHVAAEGAQPSTVCPAKDQGPGEHEGEEHETANDNALHATINYQTRRIIVYDDGHQKHRYEEYASSDILTFFSLHV